jgi:phosphoribosylformylglycinamidine (FGAM) synthase PurS component
MARLFRWPLPPPIGEVPEGLTIGQAVQDTGHREVSARLSGETLGKVDRELCSELLRVYRERRLQDPVIIDWQHATSPVQRRHACPPRAEARSG